MTKINPWVPGPKNKCLEAPIACFWPRTSGLYIAMKNDKLNLLTIRTKWFMLYDIAHHGAMTKWNGP
jgi:hypothetical protein